MIVLGLYFLVGSLSTMLLTYLIFSIYCQNEYSSIVLENTNNFGHRDLNPNPFCKRKKLEFIVYKLGSLGA